MRSDRDESVVQLRLFSGGGSGRARRGPRPARNIRMAERLELIARRLEREAGQLVLDGDEDGARESLRRARDAWRAAALLRAGSDGVADVLAS
jgi:hypothetical protein